MMFASEARLPLIANPVDGGSSGDGGTKIGDVPLESLSQGQECAMVVFVDRDEGLVLLQVPNKLGWRLHFGFNVPAIEQQDGASLWSKAREISMQSAIGVVGADLELRPAGLMLFTFQDDDHPPMRVRVFDTKIPEKCLLGQTYKFDTVPYSSMWADDIVWLPTLLEQENGYFEAHFLFKDHLVARVRYYGIVTKYTTPNDPPPLFGHLFQGLLELCTSKSRLVSEYQTRGWTPAFASSCHA